MRRSIAITLVALLAALLVPLLAAGATTVPSAKKIIDELIAKGLPAHLTIVYTAATDPNHLLGRPNGYLSKASFTDSRIPSSDSAGEGTGSVDAGGSVEVFSSASGATARAKYIESLEKADPIIGTEYDYLNGSVLLRVSHYLTPQQAGGYEQALTKLGDRSAPAASPAHKAKAPKLASVLLSIGQMPTGWSVDNSSSSGGVGCLANTLEPKGIKQTGSASVAFADNGNVPEVSEKLSTYSIKASTAFGKIVAALNSCKHLSGKANGTKVTGTVGQMSFAHYGDQSAAFNVNLTVQGANLGEDVLIVKKGTIVMGILEGDLGSPNLGQFEGFVEKALAKLSPSVPTKASQRAKTRVASLPLTAFGFLAGTAKPVVPTGVSGKVSLVMTGPVNNTSGGASVPVMVRNNTNAAVGSIDISGPANNSTGKVIASGDSQGTYPSILKPGQAALAFVYFQVGSSLPTNAKFSFTVTSSTGNSGPFASVDFKVTQANVVPGSTASDVTIAGEAVNPSKSSISPVSVGIFCFSASGTLLSSTTDFTSQETVAGGGTGSFSTDTYGACPTFLVGVNGSTN